MSKIGKLKVPLLKVPCESEVEALKILNRFKKEGKISHYIRHNRNSFTVVAYDE